MTNHESGWEISISCRTGVNLLVAFLFAWLVNYKQYNKNYMKNMLKDPRYLRIKKSLQKQIKILNENGFDVKKHWQDMQASLDKESEINPFNSIKSNKNIKKSKTDYGAITVNALKRANFDEDK